MPYVEMINTETGVVAVQTVNKILKDITIKRRKRQSWHMSYKEWWDTPQNRNKRMC